KQRSAIWGSLPCRAGFQPARRFVTGASRTKSQFEPRSQPFAIRRRAEPVCSRRRRPPGPALRHCYAGTEDPHLIARYTRPEMGRIWSEDNKYRQWLEVELAASEALAELGEVPPEAAAKLRALAGFQLERIQEIENKVKHDVIAFTTAVAETMAAANE